MIIRYSSVAITTVALVLATAASSSAAAINSVAEPSAHADDGAVYTSVQVGSRLFVAGTFTSVDGSTRLRLAALDAGTGTLDGSFRVDVDGEVRALATDGVNLFVGGKFTQVGGVPRKNLAALDVSTGVVQSNFKPAPAGTVRALAYANGMVYFGGSFTKVGTTSVTYLAAANAVTGALDSAFPSADNVVYAVKSEGNNIWVGGEFSRIGTTTRSKVAAVATSGQVLSYRASPGAPVWDLAVSSTGVFLATAGGLPAGNSLYKTTSAGEKVWQVATDGNMQTVEVLGDTVYAGGHFDNICGSTTNGCGNMTLAKKALVADAGGTVPNARAWAKFNSALGVWDLTAAGGNLYALGVFTQVNGKPLPRIARFLA
ncbi:hypothetical protein ACOCJ7_08825 [Knoellia sp. CPCC 206453]|uniref:hypothetical protein n=1 Tax=Knoellia pratensis TaxID=3404796 RepID=UPI00360B13C5